MPGEQSEHQVETLDLDPNAPPIICSTGASWVSAFDAWEPQSHQDHCKRAALANFLAVNRVKELGKSQYARSCEKISNEWSDWTEEKCEDWRSTVKSIDSACATPLGLKSSTQRFAMKMKAKIDVMEQDKLSNMQAAKDLQRSAQYLMSRAVPSSRYPILPDHVDHLMRLHIPAAEPTRTSFLSSKLEEYLETVDASSSQSRKQIPIPDNSLSQAMLVRRNERRKLEETLSAVDREYLAIYNLPEAIAKVEQAMAATTLSPDLYHPPKSVEGTDMKQIVSDIRQDRQADPGWIDFYGLKDMVSRAYNTSRPMSTCLGTQSVPVWTLCEPKDHVDRWGLAAIKQKAAIKACKQDWGADEDHKPHHPRLPSVITALSRTGEICLREAGYSGRITGAELGHLASLTCDPALAGAGNTFLKMLNNELKSKPTRMKSGNVELSHHELEYLRSINSDFDQTLTETAGVRPDSLSDSRGTASRRRATKKYMGPAREVYRQYEFNPDDFNPPDTIFNSKDFKEIEKAVLEPRGLYPSTVSTEGPLESTISPSDELQQRRGH